MTAYTAPHFPTWSLHAWPPLFWQVDRIPLLQLHHLGTYVTPSAAGGPSRPCQAGRTIWACHTDEGDAAMAWDWACDDEHQFVGISDIFGLVTNVRFVGPDGDVLTAYHATMHLARIVHELPWTDQVQRTLRQPELLC